MQADDGQRGRSRLVSPASRPTSPGMNGATSPTHLTMPTFRQQHHHLSPLAQTTRFSPASSSGSSASSTPPTQLGRAPALAQTHRTLGNHLPTLASTSSAQHPTTHHPPREHAATPPPIVTGSTLSTPSAAPATATTSYSQSLASPCFIHSHLDNTLNDFVKRESRSTSRGRRKSVRQSGGEAGRELYRTKSEGGATVKPLVGSPDSVEAPSSSNAVDDEEYDDEEEEANSWTRQLAETAVSVREMSRQLGRARVVSHIQSVMIVTKARDNQLTRLTRELALWLMKTPRNGKDRGLVVYVDSQLQKSKRFDAAGMQREHPELFRPVSSRRYSRTSSSASLATDGGPLRRGGAATPGHHGGTITPLSMTGLNEALLKRNNSISSASGAKRSEDGEEGQLRYWTNEMCRKSPHLFDFVITLGGDGTVLYTSWLFQQIVPPVIPFALGSLGFLTNFDYSGFRNTLDAAIDSGVRVNLRMRFTCTVYRAVTDDDEQACKRQAVKSGRTGGIFMKSLTREGWDAIENGRPVDLNGKKGKKDKAIKCFSTRAVESFEVLNDLVVDRGPSPFVSQLELFGDEHHMTTVQADGLTVSTPTGSTAYSLSAGGSLVHPEIPAILITPICPHTLSFRPMLLPDSMELRICVPYNSRSTAWASFDGRGRVELKQGDHIKVTASPYPFPTVCADKQSTDWFHSIARTLKWNERQRQKSFVILEEGRKKPSSGAHPANKQKQRDPSPQEVPPQAPVSGQGGSTTSSKHATFAEPVENSAEDDEDDLDDEEEDECDSDVQGEDGAEEEEEEYDIDDISEQATNASSPALHPNDPVNTVPPLSSNFPRSPTSSSSSTPVNGHLPPPLARRSTAPSLSSVPKPPPSTHNDASSISPPHERGPSSSASSAVSVDIQDRHTDRFVTEPPTRPRRDSSRRQEGGEDGRGRGKEGGGGGGQVTDDGEKSEDRAFAVVGHDSGSSEESGSETEDE
ncbi:hypothetical protein JCM8547_001935 [Rhodosporidiobolus lusitaniae]